MPRTCLPTSPQPPALSSSGTDRRSDIRTLLPRIDRCCPQRCGTGGFGAKLYRSAVEKADPSRRQSMRPFQGNGARLGFRSEPSPRRRSPAVRLSNIVLARWPIAPAHVTTEMKVVDIDIEGQLAASVPDRSRAALSAPSVPAWLSSLLPCGEGWVRVLLAGGSSWPGPVLPPLPALPLPPVLPPVPQTQNPAGFRAAGFCFVLTSY